MLFFVTFVLVALAVAWAVNTLVSILSGDRRLDIRGLWAEIISRLFLVAELGAMGRALNYFGLTGWSRKVVIILGFLCLLLFFCRSCLHPSNASPTYTFITNYPAQNP
jgi:hypothetical protein